MRKLIFLTIFLRQSNVLKTECNKAALGADCYRNWADFGHRVGVDKLATGMNNCSPILLTLHFVYIFNKVSAVFLKKKNSTF